jgi:hypothetical protein
MAREEMVRRNTALMGQLLAAGGEEALAAFRLATASYQRGEVAASAYFANFSTAFGTPATLALFPEVLQLLPDAQKRAELAHCFDLFSSLGAGSSALDSSLPPGLPPPPGGRARGKKF